MRIKMGSVVTEVSGKLGGQYFSSDRSGTSLRTNRTRGHIIKPSLLASSSIHTDIIRSWRDLDDDSRSQWRSASAQGLSGLNLFQRINFWRWQTFGDQLVTPPTNFNIFPTVDFSMTDNVNTPALTILLVTHVKNPKVKWVVRASAGQSKGTSSPRRLVYLRTVNDNQPLSFGVGPQYGAAFGTMKVGMKVFVSLQSLSNDNMLLSPPLIKSIILT